MDGLPVERRIITVVSATNYVHNSRAASRPDPLRMI